MFGAFLMLNVLPAHWVLAVMVKMQPSNRHGVRETYEETAEAIAQAANAEPLFLGEDGPMRTAALLLAIAWKESRFSPTAIGDHGRSFGLFQIQPPTADMHANMLLLPRDAAPVAISLIRTSLKVCGSFGWHERLGWYASGGNGCKEPGRRASVSRMLLAEQIVKDNPL